MATIRRKRGRNGKDGDGWTVRLTTPAGRVERALDPAIVTQEHAQQTADWLQGHLDKALDPLTPEPIRRDAMAVLAGYEIDVAAMTMPVGPGEPITRNRRLSEAAKSWLAVIGRQNPRSTLSAYAFAIERFVQFSPGSVWQAMEPRRIEAFVQARWMEAADSGKGASGTSS